MKYLVSETKSRVGFFYMGWRLDSRVWAVRLCCSFKNNDQAVWKERTHHPAKLDQRFLQDGLFSLVSTPPRIYYSYLLADVDCGRLTLVAR